MEPSTSPVPPTSPTNPLAEDKPSNVLRSPASERRSQLQYWKAVGAATVEAMMLDPNAVQLDKYERPEILRALPLSGAALAEATVVELGAGVGRFTGQLAESCKAVTAVDFLQSCIDKNREEHEHFGNVTFRCADVNDLTLPSESATLVFSNWLLMYLSDPEVRAFASNTLAWTQPGGYLVFRESCFHRSGDAARPVENPSHYRHPDEYDAMFAEAEAKTSGDDLAVWKWELVERASVRAYVELKNNPNQIRWVYKKVLARSTSTTMLEATLERDGDVEPSDNDEAIVAVSQEQLDATQYTETGILRYERIFGPGFVSTGGVVTTAEFVSRLGLKPGMRVLDVGCGIGGGDFYMAEKFGVEVVGIDLSANMVNIANRRAAAKPGLPVKFEIRDATTTEFEPESFDVIYSRDTLLHIGGKKALFQRFLGWLKLGGQLFISDYSRDFPAVDTSDASAVEASEAFESYVAQRGYHLMTPAKYGEVVASAGFVDVNARDETSLFVSSLERELAATEGIRESFEAEFSAEDYEYIVSGWRKKLVFTSGGFQKWAVVHARKAVSEEEESKIVAVSQEQLDATQYTETGILRYERIFGPGFVSTGGVVTTAEFVSRLGLKPGMRVLDVGCGIGGGDFYMAEKFGVEVVGIDLSANMVNIANRRAAAKPGLPVKFEIRDATTTEFEPESFDVIYSRDTLLHIGGKKALFQRFLGWLKPGGQLFISDYSRDFPAVDTSDASAVEASEAFESYVAQRGYHLMTPAKYGEVVASAGFVDVNARDETSLFVSSLERELAATEGIRESFEAEFSAEDYEYIVSGWRKKLVFTSGGFQKWAVVHARKAVSEEEESKIVAVSQEQLDATQYTETGILRYERIFGPGFVSTGGVVTTAEFVSRLGLKPGMRVLDVGCGIGGGDFYMAEKFGVEVVGIDLSANMVNIANRRAAAKPGLPVKFEIRDATTTEFEPESFDVIYSRDTLLHIGGKKALFQRFLGWLKLGGQLFISDYARDFPAVDTSDASAVEASEAFESYVAQRGYHLMTPAKYGEVVASAGFVDVNARDETSLFVSSLERELAATEGIRESFEAEFSAEDYEYIVSGWRKKLVFTSGGFQKWAVVHARKAVSEEEESKIVAVSQEQLDATQYTETGILRYERIFGPGFVSTGGVVTTAEFVSRLGLKPGMRVLDVGCGIGGGDFYMAEKFGVEVVGIDLSANMVNIANRRAAAKPGLPVKFEIRDATTTEFEPESFDVIYSRDTLLHIGGKKALFQRFLGWLKPGGQLFISDYARDFPAVDTSDASAVEASEAFESYVAQRGYHLMTPAKYGEVVASAGFVDVNARDETSLFVSSLERELAATEGIRESFEAEFSAEDYEYIVSGWRKKLVFTSGGFQKWAVVHARKQL